MGDTFQLISKRAEKMKRRQPIQHALGAGLLILAGWDHLHRPGGHSALPLFEIAAGAALILSIIRERLRHHAPGNGIAWVELAGAIMLFVEAFSKLEEPHHLLLYILSFVPPVLFLAFAMFDTQIAAMRRLTADDDAFSMRLRLFFRKRVAWRDIASWVRTTDSIDAAGHNGRTTRFKFKGVVNREEAMEWAAAQFARRVSAAKELPGRDGRAEESDHDQILVTGQRRQE